MTSNYVVSVTKLKGRENYAEWAFAAENFLVLEGTSECIKNTSTKPEEATADAKTKAKLILTIDSSLFVHIKEVKSTKELWDKLKQLFDDSGFTRRISLLRNLISIRLENCTSMTSYVTEIIDTSQKLRGTGFCINDEWVGSLLLAGLTDKYSPMIMAIEHSGIAITADAIKTKLMDLEEVGGQVIGAFGSFGKNQYGNTTGSSRNNGSLSMSEGKQKIVNVKCYKCKKPGHYRNQCTEENWDNNSRERKSTNAFSAVFSSGNFGKNDWHLDSGASRHLTANPEWIKNPSHKHSIKKIVLANKEKAHVQCAGDVTITTLTEDCEYEVVVEDVLCVPSLTTNLISVSQLIKKGNSIQFTTDGCQIHNRAGELVATAYISNGVYKLRLREAEMQDAVEGLTLDRKTDASKSLSTCREGKQSRLPFLQNGNRSHVLKEKRPKWHKKAEKVEYAGHIKGHCIYNPRTKDIKTSQDVVVRDKPVPAESAVPIEEATHSEKVTVKMPVDSVGDVLEDAGSGEFHGVDDDTFHLAEDEESSGSNVESVLEVNVVRSSQRQRRPPDRSAKGSEECFVAGLQQTYESNKVWEHADAPKDSATVEGKNYVKGMTVPMQE